MPKKQLLARPFRFLSAACDHVAFALGKASLMVGAAAESCAPLFGDGESRKVGYFESAENAPANSGGTKLSPILPEADRI